jgi:hypothetical protein
VSEIKYTPPVMTEEEERRIDLGRTILGVLFVARGRRATVKETMKLIWREPQTFGKIF